MEYKTTLKEIRNFDAVDITLHQDIYKLKQEENGLENICYSKGVCGWNGQVVKGNKTGTYYKIVGRTSNLFAL